MRRLREVDKAVSKTKIRAKDRIRFSVVLVLLFVLLLGLGSLKFYLGEHYTLGDVFCLFKLVIARIFNK